MGCSALRGKSFVPHNSPVLTSSDFRIILKSFLKLEEEEQIKIALLDASHTHKRTLLLNSICDRSCLHCFFHHQQRVLRVLRVWRVLARFARFARFALQVQEYRRKWIRQLPEARQRSLAKKLEVQFNM